MILEQVAAIQTLFVINITDLRPVLMTLSIAASAETRQRILNEEVRTFRNTGLIVRVRELVRYSDGGSVDDVTASLHAELLNSYISF